MKLAEKTLGALQNTAGEEGRKFLGWLGVGSRNLASPNKDWPQWSRDPLNNPRNLGFPIIPGIHRQDYLARSQPKLPAPIFWRPARLGQSTPTPYRPRWLFVCRQADRAVAERDRDRSNQNPKNEDSRVQRFSDSR